MFAALGAFGAAGASAIAISHETVSTPGPVIEYGITPELNCSARYAGDVKSEFYGDTSCVTAIALPDGIYAPSDIPAGNTLEEAAYLYETEGQTRGGDGTAANPYSITTKVLAEDIRLTQVDTYVSGSNRLRTHMTLHNTGSQVITFDVFRVGDCYARDSDYGYGQMGDQWAACVSQYEARTVRFLAETNPDAQPIAGTWQGHYLDLWSRVASYAPGGERLAFNGSCRCSESIDNSAGLKWTITLAPGATQTIRSAIDFGAIANTGGFGQPSQLKAGGKPYVALGDSYSSGEGAGNPSPRTKEQREGFRGHDFTYYPGTDDKNNKCHRSPNAYPALVAARLPWLNGTEDLDFRACSGAVIRDLTNSNQKNANEPAQVDAIGADTRMVTLTIGGNDADFTGIVSSCINPFGAACNTAKANSVRDTYLRMASNDQSESISLLKTYTNVNRRLSPGASLYVLGYPDFTPYARNGSGCTIDGQFTQAESDWLSNWITMFNSLIRHRSGRAGARFIDVDALYQSPTNRSHRVCSLEEWVNSVFVVTENRKPKILSESFHPNKLGQLAYADALTPQAQGVGGQQAHARAHQTIAPGSGATTLVIRKDAAATTPVPVADGQTTVLSLRYDGAIPRYTLADGAGTPVQIGQIDDTSAVLPKPHGANIAQMGDITSLELRGLPAGTYTLSAQLEADAPTDAGVLRIVTSSYAEENLAPFSAMRVSVNKKRKLSFSAAGSFDPEGAPLAYRWTFGDKRARTSAKSTHRYRKAGRYTVGLRVSDPAGASANGRVIVDTRIQKIASVRVVRSGKRAIARVSCVRRLAVEGCQVRLRTVARTPGRRAVIRTRTVTLNRGATGKYVVALPKAKRGKVTRVQANVVASDAAIRPGKSRAKATLNLRR